MLIHIIHTSLLDRIPIMLFMYSFWPNRLQLKDGCAEFMIKQISHVYITLYY